MKLLRHVEGKLSLLLVLAIMVLCAGFFIVSCGNKPQKKTNNPNTDKGAYAIDFSLCPAGKTCTAIPKGSEVTRIPNISGQEVTLEAWIKVGAATSTPHIIFDRFNDWGAKLFLENNIPKFAIGRLPIQTTSTEPAGCTQVGVTSTECTLSSGITLATDVWTHVAGVLVNQSDNSSVHPACSGAQAGAESQIPHLDMYINGAFVDCSTTGQLPVDNPGDEDMHIGSLDGGAVDELRFWVSARTQAEISNCMNTELGIGGVCDRGTPALAAYYRLNAGEGADVSDSSGNGFSGGFEYRVSEGVFEEWTDGWVTPGAPVAPAD